MAQQVCDLTDGTMFDWQRFLSNITRECGPRSWAHWSGRVCDPADWQPSVVYPDEGQWDRGFSQRQRKVESVWYN
jgi:hypothetical protein